MNSPCLQCIRVRDPQICENKQCNDWQAWFLDRWESMRENVRNQIKNAPVQESGVPLGGHRYAAPHQIQTFLKKDPCNGCTDLKNLCRQPCNAKARWNQMRHEVTR